jgi:hypothetical protein
MKILLLFLIKCYWKLIPLERRKLCLFSESCSKYVFRVTNERGIIQGLKALKFRVKKCNPNYIIIKVNNNFKLIFNDGSELNNKEISPFLLPPYSLNQKLIELK